MIFQWFDNLIKTWKNLLMMFNDKKIILSSNADKIIFCWERKYASDHNFVLIWQKLMTILDLLFFQLTNVKKTAENELSKKTDYT